MEWTLTIAVVWALFTSSLVQVIIHGTTYFVLRRQVSLTTVGPSLKRREGSLAIKAGFRTVIDLILAVLVTWDYYLFNHEVRIVIYAFAILSVAAAIVYGWSYIVALRDHRFGIPDPKGVMIDGYEARQPVDT